MKSLEFFSVHSLCSLGSDLGRQLTLLRPLPSPFQKRKNRRW